MSVQSLEICRRFSLHGKSYFLFPAVLKRWSFQKKLHWNMIFLLLSGKIIFLFPENMILYLRRKMKDDLSQKNTQKYDIFFKLSEKMVFPKRAAPAHDPSCIIWKYGVFFSRKHDVFSLGRKWEAVFLRKYMDIWRFLCTRTGVTNVVPHPSVKKNQRLSYPAKIHLKVIDALDWHSRKSSGNSACFHGNLYRRFHALLSSQEKQES